MSVSINDIENREQLISLVIGQLRENGVKYRKETKPNNKKQVHQSYTYLALHLLYLLDERRRRCRRSIDKPTTDRPIASQSHWHCHTHIT